VRQCTANGYADDNECTNKSAAKGDADSNGGTAGSRSAIKISPIGEGTAKTTADEGTILVDEYRFTTGGREATVETTTSFGESTNNKCRGSGCADCGEEPTSVSSDKDSTSADLS
jgi:hypothetical protein